MEYRPLGQTHLKVSVICLGTMTWGEQNTEAEAHEQLDYALEQGVNFIDTAEMYPVPGKAETSGRTESYIGSWLNARKNRDKVILATKVAGPAEWMPWIRGTDHTLDRKNIIEAVEGSLRRLQTDTIDLYQLHWPARNTNYFGRLGYTHQPGESTEDVLRALEETLKALEEMIQAGKVRYVGLSNETPWGVMHFLERSQRLGLPRMMSIQNPYSLLNRSFEVGLSEVAIREQCGLLAYSPLAFGTLTGKYMHGAMPPGSRLSMWGDWFDRYSNSQAVHATEAYVTLAQTSGLRPAQMALAYVNSRDFITSNIIGATSMAQLKENIDSIQVTLPPHVVEQIEAIHHRYPNPSP